MGNHERMMRRRELLRQQMEAAAESQLKQRELCAGEATVEVGRTPGGPRFKGPNQRMRRAESGLYFFGTAAGVEHWRDGKQIGEYDANNTVVNEGLNAILDKMFDGDTQITAWYIGLIDNSGWSTIALTDTYDDIDQVANGWDEFPDYTDANNANSAVTRPEWVADPASGQSISNGTTKAIYDITAGGTVKGVFVAGGTNAQTKSDHTAAGNVLLSAALFSGGDVIVVNGDQLKVTYTMNAANP